MIEEQSKPYDSKKNVWVPDAEEGYLAAEVQSEKGDLVDVITGKMNQTYSGLFCVVINPYKRLPIYTDSVARMYIGKRKNEMPPHLFANSDEAYRNMIQDHENQSMLITGESGAGKTENTKKVIAYFASVGASQAEAADAIAAKKEKTETPKEKRVTLEDQIVRTNPVLEAFGNARTVRNNNSSRFGKFIRIMFNKAGKVASCDIEHYLLEKSRVIRQAPGERCYHIFYQMQSGFVPDLKQKLLLDLPIKEYYFCAQAELTVDGMDDKEEMGITEESFDVLKFSAEEKFDCYRLMSAICHMGIMKFKQRPREEQAEADGTDEQQKAADMYGVDMEAFVKALTRPRVRVGNEWVNKGQNLEQVSWAVGAMAKALYARVFHWIVSKCNMTLDQKGLSRDYFIGVLDIAGFEIFDFNSFEQLWINFVNEKLQQFFNHHMFVLEQEEYAREGIQWTFIDFGLDLQACIELIEKPLGIISMLDEECIVPKATDLTLAQKLNEQHLGKHPNFVKPPPPKGKQAEAHFAMKHYAGLVRYNCMKWLEKNKDPLNDTLVAVLKASPANALLNTVWADYTTQEEAAELQKSGADQGGKKKGKSGSFMTVSMVYRESLNKLMTMLHATHPHFIRCIIPNEKKTSGLIDAGLVLNQLTCNGVLEGIRICRKGFPNRTLHEDFRQRYAILAAEEAKDNTKENAPKVAKAMLDRIVKEGILTDENFRLGGTKVFFKAGVLAKLEDFRDEKLRIVMTAFQSHIRWYLGLTQKKRLQQQKVGILVVQRNVRRWCSLRVWPWFELYAKVRPMIYALGIQEQLDALTEKIKTLEGDLNKESTMRADYTSQQEKLLKEKAELERQLAEQRAKLGDMSESMLRQFEQEKAALDAKLEQLNDQLSNSEDTSVDLQKAKKRAEQEADGLKKNIQDLEMSLRKADSEKSSKDHNIRSLQDELQQLDETIAKLNKEKKQQEEINKKLLEDLHGNEDKTGHANKIKQKLEQSLEDAEDTLEREKRNRAELEKTKRKTEGDLKIAQENIEESLKQRHDLENNLKRKEAELHNLSTRLEDEQGTVAKLQRQIKETQARVSELDEELRNERDSRSRSERARIELQNELEDLNNRLEEQGGATAAQVELNKKREAELSSMRRDLEQNNLNHENALSSLKKKHQDAVAELGDQLDQLTKSKQRLEKERSQIQRAAEDIQNQLDAEGSAKLNGEKTAKALELQLQDLQQKADDQARQLHDFLSVKGRLSGQNGDLARQLEDGEAELTNLSKLKSQLNAQLDEARRVADQEGRETQTIKAQSKIFQNEAEQLRNRFEEEQESKSEVLRQLNKANQEIHQWQSRLEGEGLLKIEEIEEAKRRQAQKINEIQEALDAANSKINSLEKTRTRLVGELDDAQVEVERANELAGALNRKQQGFDRVALDAANSKINSLEKTRTRLVGELDDAQVEVERANELAGALNRKQQGFDRVVDEWRKKTDDLSAELDAIQRENRNLSTDVFKMKADESQLSDTIEGLRRENKNITQEIRDLSDQLGEGGRSVHEMQKIIRRVELEKEELQRALDEAEGALEAEESKVLRAQVEVSQIRSEIEKRIQEKEEEFENTRRNHARAMESMQASLEAESRTRAELLRVKKNLEGDINELEIGLDHANKANADAQKSIKRHLEQIRELQLQLDEEQRSRDELRDQYLNAEKRCQILDQEKDDLQRQLDEAERVRRQAELDATDLRDQLNELTVEVNALNGAKRKLEGEIQAIHADLDETLNEYRASEERSKKAMADAARLADELRQEQEHVQHVDRLRKGLEQAIRELQVRLEEAEAAALKGGKKVIAKLEQRIRELEGELDGEQRRFQEGNKNLAKEERRMREFQFQVDEDKKNFSRLQDLVEKLQGKLRAQKKQLEEAEEIANTNLQKYKALTHQLEQAEERADVAENSLSKVRSKSRSAIGADIARSQSAAVVRGRVAFDE
uniref:Myosin heavy chain n=1 Tax=Acrobeloides nanus TaxID=290746 RepID=A0A914CDF9_9BILA